MCGFTVIAVPCAVKSGVIDPVFLLSHSLSQVDVVEHECFGDPNKTKQVSLFLESYSDTLLQEWDASNYAS